MKTKITKITKIYDNMAASWINHCISYLRNSSTDAIPESIEQARITMQEAIVGWAENLMKDIPVENNCKTVTITGYETVTIIWSRLGMMEFKEQMSSNYCESAMYPASTFDTEEVTLEDDERINTVSEQRIRDNLSGLIDECVGRYTGWRSRYKLFETYIVSRIIGTSTCRITKIPAFRKKLLALKSQIEQVDLCYNRYGELRDVIFDHLYKPDITKEAVATFVTEFRDAIRCASTGNGLYWNIRQAMRFSIPSTKRPEEDELDARVKASSETELMDAYLKYYRYPSQQVSQAFAKMPTDIIPAMELFPEMIIVSKSNNRYGSTALFQSKLLSLVSMFDDLHSEYESFINDIARPDDHSDKDSPLVIRIPSDDMIRKIKDCCVTTDFNRMCDYQVRGSFGASIIDAFKASASLGELPRNIAWRKLDWPQEYGEPNGFRYTFVSMCEHIEDNVRWGNHMKELLYSMLPDLLIKYMKTGKFDEKTYKAHISKIADDILSSDFPLKHDKVDMGHLILPNSPAFDQLKKLLIDEIDNQCKDLDHIEEIFLSSEDKNFITWCLEKRFTDPKLTKERLKQLTEQASE